MDRKMIMKMFIQLNAIVLTSLSLGYFIMRGTESIISPITYSLCLIVAANIGGVVGVIINKASDRL